MPTSSSRLTLSLGGAGIAVATIGPLISRAVVAFAASWQYYPWERFVEPVSAVVLAAALIVLALGIGAEAGIVGSSVVGRGALIVFALSGLVLAGMSLAPMQTLSDTVYTGASEPSRVSTALIEAAGRSTELLGLAALAVASVIVVRAGVLRGAARWGLLVLAVVTVLTLAAEYVPVLALAEIGMWGDVVTPLIQLLLGALCLLQGLIESKPRPQLAAA